MKEDKPYARPCQADVCTAARRGVTSLDGGNWGQSDDPAAAAADGVGRDAPALDAAAPGAGARLSGAIV